MPKKTNQEAPVTRNAKAATKIAEKFHEEFSRSFDIKTGLAALKGYAVAGQLHRDLLVYKRLSGKPERIDFYEGEN